MRMQFPKIVSRAMLILVHLLVLPISLHAGLNYPDFASTDGLNLVRDAFQSGGCVLRLTSAASYEEGAAWYVTKVALQGGFDSVFRFRITGSGGVAGGADGFAFVVQNSSATAWGEYGGQIGYGGIPNSLAVEFDTYRNGEHGDTDNNHISVHTRGLLPNSAHESYALSRVSGIPDLNNGSEYTVLVRYRPGVMHVYLNDLSVPILTASVDLAGTLQLDNGTAWLGFTSGTGSGWGNHEILSWTVDSNPPPSIPPTTPIETSSPYCPPPIEPGETLHRLKGQMHAHWFCDFSQRGLDYCNEHTHTPSKVVQDYSDNGFDFVCLTEHNHSTLGTTAGNAYTLDYCSEVTAAKDDQHPDEPVYHILAIGTLDDTGYGSDIDFSNAGPGRDESWDDAMSIDEVPWESDSTNYTAQETIDRVVSMGGFAFIPHPDQMDMLGKNFTYDDMLDLHGGSEWPSGMAIRTAAIGEDAIGLWDKLLRVSYSTMVATPDGVKSYPLFGYAEEDYTPGVPVAQSVAGSAWVAADAWFEDDASVEVKRAKVKEALASGRFVSYWTNNSSPWGDASYPLLDISVSTDGNRPVIHVSTEHGEVLDHIQFIGKRSWYRSDTLPDGDFEDVSSASYTCTGTEGYVRIQCEYKIGGKPRLWIASQPMWVYPTGLVGPYESASAPASLSVSSTKSAPLVSLEATAELILTYVAPDDYPSAGPPQGYIGFVYNVTSSTGTVPSGTSLALSFAGEDLTAVGLDNLAVYYFNPSTGVWASLGGTADPGAKTISAQISQEGLYTISASLPTDTEAPTASIISPSLDEVVCGETEFKCLGTDNIGVLRTQFYLNGRNVGEDVYSEDGWSVDLDTTPYVSGPYTLKVVVEDASGNRGETTRTFAIDSPTPPPTVDITSHSGGENLVGIVTLTGTCSDDEAVAEVWILVDGLPVVPAEIDEGTWTAVLDTDQLAGGTRTLGAKVEDYYGNSAVDTIQVNTPLSLGHSKARQDGESVFVEGCIVTAGTPEMGGAFYMEAADRSSGIRVATDLTVNRGDLVRVAGTIATLNGERQINATDVHIISLNNALPNPLGNIGRSLMIGLDPTGLLVRTWGKVTQIGTNHFYIDDGSAYIDPAGYPGVRVVAQGLSIPLQGERVQVTAIASCYQDGDVLYRMLRPRQQSDIVTLDTGSISGQITLSGYGFQVDGCQVEFPVLPWPPPFQPIDSPHPYLDHYTHDWGVWTNDYGTGRVKLHFAKLQLRGPTTKLFIRDGRGETLAWYAECDNVGFWTDWLVPFSWDTMFFPGLFLCLETHNPAAPGVTVSLDPVGMVTQTDSSGQYRFEALPAGQYTIIPLPLTTNVSPASLSPTLGSGHQLSRQDFVLY